LFGGAGLAGGGSAHGGYGGGEVFGQGLLGFFGQLGGLAGEVEDVDGGFALASLLAAEVSAAGPRRPGGNFDSLKSWLKLPLNSA
jgi:hypothetical protein